MPLKARVTNLVRNLFDKSAVERELDEELRAAEDALRERYVAGGMEEQAARRAARLDLGAVEPVKDVVRDVRVGEQLETLISDTRYALRGLRNAPAFTAAAVRCCCGCAWCSARWRCCSPASASTA